jgi:catalase
MATTTQKYTLAALVLAAGLWPVAAQDAALETQIVDAMNKVYGVHPGFRANHCKSRSNNPSLKRPICSAAPESNCGI